MSTNTPHISKLTTVLVFLSGTYLFFISIILAPYINAPFFYSFYTATKLILVIATGLIALLQLLFLVPRIPTSFLTGVSKNVKRVSLIGIVVFICSILFSASFKTSVWGMYTAWEYNVMTYLIFGILLFSWFVYFLVLRHYQLAQTVFVTLLNLAILVAVFYGIGEHYWWKPTTGYVSNFVSRISLGFQNPLFAAYFLGMLWAGSFAQAIKSFIEKKKLIVSLGQLVLFGGITHVLLLTFTRSAWIASTATICIYLGYLILTSLRQKETLSRLFVGTGIVFLVIFAQAYTFRSQIAQRNNDLSPESKQTLTTIASTLGKTEDPKAALVFYQNAGSYSSSTIRLLEWGWGIRTVISSPKNFLFGIGPDAGFFEMPKYRNAVFNNIPTDASVKPFYIRNLYINFLMQHGVIVTLCVIALAIYLLVALKKSNSLPSEGVIVILAYFMQGMFYYPTLLTTVLFVFALGFTLATKAPLEKILLQKPTFVEKGILLVILVGILTWIIPVSQGEYVTSTYTQMSLPATSTEMEKNSKIAINNNVLKRYLVYFYPNNSLAKTYEAELAASNDIDDLRIAADAYYTIARNNNSEPDANKSIDVLKRLTSIDPTLPSNWDALGLRYLFLGNFDQALVQFKKALELKPDYWYSYLHIGETLRQQCKPSEAIDWYKKAAAYVPSTEAEIQEAQTEMKTPRKECVK